MLTLERLTLEELRAEIQRLWLKHWATLEEQQSLVATMARKVEEHALMPGHEDHHQAMVERYVEARARLRQHLAEYLGTNAWT